jgi:Holliday junction resolvasome RuvABC endonuclease subunit
VILGLDLSLTATGWATIHNDGTTHTGTIPDSKGHIADRLDTWGRHLSRIIRDACDAATDGHISIYVEDLAGNQRGAFELGMIHATFWFELTTEIRRQTTMVNATTLKTYATGKGNASKALVLVEAVKRLGYPGHDDNEADALWLADMGARLAGYQRPDLPATHLRALDRINKHQEANT